MLLGDLTTSRCVDRVRQLWVVVRFGEQRREFIGRRWSRWDEQRRIVRRFIRCIIGGKQWRLGLHERAEPERGRNGDVLILAADFADNASLG